VAICPSCGKENPDGFQFCGFCTAQLTEQPRSSVQEERKVVSVLFCDLVGFTAVSERQDPEDVRARLRPYHARLRTEIERHGGTVEKFVGDAIMAAFGAPVAHEDDAERAVRAALGILDAIAELNDSDPELDLKVRVGINTGEAVVAVGANPERGEGIVTGDVVNTANRIESVSPVNSVSVSEQTYRTTSHIFEYEPLEPVMVKGKAEPLGLWQAKAVRIRFGTDFHEHATPFVGRELEKPLLIGIYERAMQRRSAQLVTIVGEPGVGKSRIVAELFAYMHAKPEIVRWRQGRCLPYGEGITFWALGEIVKREAAILESDSSEVALQKLEAALSPDSPDRQWLIQRLAPLVGVETAAPAERQESFTAWRRYFEGLAAARETVLVFEDLHWADEALLVFLEHLAEWAGDVPLLIICSARPELYERRPGWAVGQRNAHTINLSPLSDEETYELVSHLVAVGTLTPELRRAILEQAGGNPLYAEEFVRLLSDRGLALGEMTLPETVQALIAARLDTLSPERKSLLQDAAVIGKVFWTSAVAEMGGLDVAEVELALHELARKELVRPARTSSMEGESEYSFWHLLVRDVAYAQIPRVERSRRHRAAAEWIGRKAGERVEDLAEVLAHHYLQALELAQAAGDAAEAEVLVAPARRFLALAGERALGLDTAQAEARLARALELTPSDDVEWPNLVVRWADAAMQAGRPREAAEALDQALVSLRARGDTEDAALALLLRSQVAFRSGDSGMWFALAAEAVALLEPETPGPELVHAYAQLASTRAIAGAYAEAIAAADRARSLAETLGLPAPARALGYRGYARVWLGDADGLAEMERALVLLVEGGAGRDAAVLQNNLAIARYPVEGPARALAAFEEGIAFCEQRGLREAANVLQGNCPRLLSELGRPEEALERVRGLAAVADASGDMYSMIEPRSVEVTTRVARGEREAGRAGADWLIQAARAVGTAEMVVFALAAAAAAVVADDPARASTFLVELEQKAGAHEAVYYASQLAEMVRTALAVGDSKLAKRLADGLEPRYPLDEHALRAARAPLAEHDGKLGEAIALYAEAASRWQEFGNVTERAYALFGQGRCLRALGRPGAEEPLLEARDLFASMGYKPALEETDALLGKSETATV
jgi:class 3 adenylate cyclase/tetratricopeptide (TPR) repeat protein